MDAFIDLSWRLYPGSALIVAGFALVAWGFATMTVAARRSTPIELILGIRRAIGGLVIAGLAGAWMWHQVWLFVLALAFLGEEALETSIVLFALRRHRRMEQDTPAGGTRRPLAAGPAA